MSGPASEDAFLVAKCLEFCHALSSQGQVFNISISTRSGFSSLDVRSKASPSNTPEKKASPSTLRRNAKRREEFLARKQQSSPTTDSGGVEAVTEALECDQCEYVGASEKGLKKAKEHRPSSIHSWGSKEQGCLLLACSPMWSYWPGTMGRWCLSWSRLKWVSSVPCQTTQSLWFLGWSSLCPQKVVCTFCTYSNQLWQHIDLKVKLTGGVQLTRSRDKQHILFSHVT